ncbi:MAG: 30S ribosomal protein S16 [Desulfarculus sp.]|jgi:small subunit ribosomal protein S16|nr:MAG: 30S ribosomal protein S16 [Desulfarculus sp.]
MAVRIRLSRKGAKKKPFYRIVAADSEAPRDGSFLEVLGTYDPLKEPAEVKVKSDLLQKWLDQGATLSDTVSSLLKARGLLPPAAKGEAVAAQS